MTSSPTKTTRDGPSKVSSGWWRTRVLLAALIFALTIRQMQFHTVISTNDDSSRQLLGNHEQEFLPLMLMNLSKSFEGEAVRGNRTSAVEAAKSTLTGKRQFSKYAYAFVLGGCNPDEDFPAYRSFIYNILVSTRVLREAGSQADVIAFFQISYKSTYDRLPSEDVRLLEAMNVRIEYIPKSPQESFYRTGKYISCQLDG
jgi:hypothetical protein